MYWCSYRKCYIREQKDARPRVDVLTATTSNNDLPKIGDDNLLKPPVLLDKVPCLRILAAATRNRVFIVSLVVRSGEVPEFNEVASMLV
jgi:hypothetical protein